MAEAGRARARELTTRSLVRGGSRLVQVTVRVRVRVRVS